MQEPENCCCHKDIFQIYDCLRSFKVRTLVSVRKRARVEMPIHKVSYLSLCLAALSELHIVLS